MKKGKFQPEWRNRAPEPFSFRSIFKWGSPEVFEHPNDGFCSVVKETLELSEADFQTRHHEGDEPVVVRPDARGHLSGDQVRMFESIVGSDNIDSDDYTRVKFSTGKTMEEIHQLRDNTTGDICDLVVHPRSKADVEKIVAYAHEQHIPIYVYGGGTSVTLGTRPVKGGVTLVMATHMNRVLELSEVNQTITVESGIAGPALEHCLNQAPALYKTRHCYTCGHFPQSFEFATVGGWIVTRGSGQMSTYYGDACDLVISQEYVTPVGSFKTLDYPATATGPMVNDILKGSEGAFGVLVSVTLRIFRHQPENRYRFSYLFPSFFSGAAACREICRGEFGMPSLLRLSDEEETQLGLRQYNIEGTLLDRFLVRKGFAPGKRSLLMGHTEGERNFSKNVRRSIRKICRAHGGMCLSGYPARAWEKTKFSTPYLRDDLNDFGIWLDTLETAVTWAGFEKVYKEVRAFIKSRPQTVCLTHCSHFYPQGTNLYFIFIGRFATLAEYKSFQTGIVEQILQSGGSLSHHHGVGKMAAPFLKNHLGKEQMAVLKALKAHFDPRSIMNPGGTLGLD